LNNPENELLEKCGGNCSNPSSSSYRTALTEKIYNLQKASPVEDSEQKHSMNMCMATKINELFQISDRASGGTGWTCSPTFGQGGHNIFCTPIFCDKK